jgi:hypothetical protein
MKRFSLLAAAAFALLAPSFVSAGPVKLVYRPEFRAYVMAKPETKGETVARSRKEEIAFHEAMAMAYRTANRKGVFDPALHCDRLIAQLRKAGDDFGRKSD